MEVMRSGENSDLFALPFSVRKSDFKTEHQSKEQQKELTEEIVMPKEQQTLFCC